MALDSETVGMHRLSCVTVLHTLSKHLSVGDKTVIRLLELGLKYR
jgi:hypothetical protein